ncbi:MAG: hypothetical protein WC378_10295 [Opitutaceae bacterium]|jgi:hypothetical protein
MKTKLYLLLIIAVTVIIVVIISHDRSVTSIHEQPWPASSNAMKSKAPTSSTSGVGEISTTSKPDSPTNSEFLLIGAKYRKMPLGEERTKAMAELIRQWVLIDPRACMDYLASLGQDPARVMLSKLAMQLWLSQDAVTACTYAETMIRENDENSKYFLKPVLEQFLLDKKGFSAVTAYLNSLPQTSNVYAEMTSLFTVYLKEDKVGALAFAQSRTLDSVKTNYLQMAGGYYATIDPNAALADLKAGKITSQDQLDGTLFALLNKRPVETLDWLINQPISPTIEVLKQRESFSRVQSDPETALRIAESLSRDCPKFPNF